MSLVTTIIPTYNRAELLPRALRSVVGQSRPPDEVIVVDDGSTDGTRRLVEEEFPDVAYVYQENRGVSAARNRGIADARGEWIALLDSDDEWLPRKLEKQLQALGEEPRYRICHTDEIWIRRGRRVNPREKHAKAGGDVFERCLPLCAISPSSVLIHRDLFVELGVFDECLPVCEDYDLWLRLSAAHPVLYVDEPLIVKYGGHDDQLSRRHWGMDRFRIRALEKIVRSGRLDRRQLRAALDALLEKTDIFLGGARKRGKEDEVAAYEDLRASHQRLRSSLFPIGNAPPS
ncbi:MAG: glycosyltransferase [Planctomycetota bacterium]|nr:glycosyltransferase [Planctomycetota bacterium]